MKNKFRKISLHNNLITRVEDVVKERGYRSIAEFISEATRLRIEELANACRRESAEE